MPLTMQAKLLRAIESRTVRPVGSDAEVAIDVRFVAATHRDLETDTDDGRFRRDLFFRINVIQIPVPPLRVRANDILLLSQHFLERAVSRSGKGVLGFSPSAAERLLGYPWPGNVRELQNAIERAVALCAFERITPEDLPDRIRTHRRAQLVLGGEDVGALLPMPEVERRYILHVLETAGGNKTLAARILGFDRRTMYRKLERFEDEPGDAEGLSLDRAARRASPMIPDPVRKLIAEHIDSVEQLEVLILLRAHRDRAFTVSEVNDRIKSSATSVEGRLSDLAGRGFLQRTDRTYRYQASPEVDATVAESGQRLRRAAR